MIAQIIRLKVKERARKAFFFCVWKAYYIAIKVTAHKMYNLPQFSFNMPSPVY